MGRFIVVCVGVFSNVEGGFCMSEGIFEGIDWDGWGFKEVVWVWFVVFKGDGGYFVFLLCFLLRYLLGINVVLLDSGVFFVGVSGDWDLVIGLGVMRVVVVLRKDVGEGIRDVILLRFRVSGVVFWECCNVVYFMVELVLVVYLLW